MLIYYFQVQPARLGGLCEQALYLHHQCFSNTQQRTCIRNGSSLKMLPGASVRKSTHGKGHEEGGFGIRKGGIEPQETPSSRASTPKTRVYLLYCFMLSPIPLTLRGADPPLPLSEKEITYSSKPIKIPGRDKSVSNYELL